jgi:hypothetical protein
MMSMVKRIKITDRVAVEALENGQALKEEANKMKV